MPAAELLLQPLVVSECRGSLAFQWFATAMLPAPQAATSPVGVDLSVMAVSAAVCHVLWLECWLLCLTSAVCSRADGCVAAVLFSPFPSQSFLVHLAPHQPGSVRQLLLSTL
jgi:hypothetical protein